MMPSALPVVSTGRAPVIVCIAAFYPTLKLFESATPASPPAHKKHPWLLSPVGYLRFGLAAAATFWQASIYPTLACRNAFAQIHVRSAGIAEITHRIRSRNRAVFSRNFTKTS